MKLILSVDAITPPLSGIGRYTWELAARMERAREVERVRYFRNEQWIRRPETLLREPVPGTPRRFKLPRWAKRCYWPRACRGHVFHGTNYFLPPYAENGVVTVHDLSVVKFPELHPLERVRQFEASFQKTLDLSVHLITHTETTRTEVMRYFAWPADRITAIYPGVAPGFSQRSAQTLIPALARFKLSPGAYALCVSTIEPRKRIDALLNAYARLPARLRVECPLILIGSSGWLNESVQEKIASGLREGWLCYLGYVGEADLHALLAGARLFVYPSAYEGFGLPMAEAMASGVPVVTSDRSCLPEVAGGAARLINPDDIDAFVVALEEGLTDETWRENAIKCGLQVASRYDWARCVAQTIAVYAVGLAAGHH